MTSYLATIVIDHLVSKYAPGLNEQLLKTSRVKPRIKLNYNIYTVEPPLTATSPQRPFFFVPADSPYIGFCLNPALQRQPPVKRVPNGQYNLLTMAVFSATDEKVKKGHEI